jgi:anti-sigma-K factor RskA
VSDTPTPDPYDVASLSGLYALDALVDPEDLERFEEAMAASAELRREVAEFRETAARLGELSATDPPASLRDAVLEQVSRTRQDQPILTMVDRRGGRRVRSWWLAAAAAVVVLATALGMVIGRGTVSAPTSELAQVLSRSDARVVKLSGEVATGARLVWSPSAGRAVFVASGLEELPEDRVYELWRLAAGGAEPVGLFRPGADGRIEAAFDVDLRGADGLGVTVEPAGGSETPTLPIVLSGELR